MSGEDFPELKIIEQAKVEAAVGNSNGLLYLVTLVVDRNRPRQAHMHGVPVFIIPVSGLCVTLAGPDMDVYVHAPGSVMEIAAGVPHVGVNLDPDVPVVAHKLSVSPDIKADTHRLPEYDALVEHRTRQVHDLYRQGKLSLTTRTRGVVSVMETAARFVDLQGGRGRIEP